MSISNLILLDIDTYYFEQKFLVEKLPLKKYRYWQLLQKCYELRRRITNEKYRRNKENTKFIY